MDEPQPDEIAAAWEAAMRRGDFHEAWRQTDRLELPRRARQHEAGFVRGPEHLRWDGTPLTGRSVLVRCEHGLGDTLQFVRFIPQLSALARKVTLLVQPHLLALLQEGPGLGTVLNGWTDEPAPAHEVEIEIMELAYALRVDLDTLPPPYPHLPDRVAGQLGFQLPAEGKLRVGLVWAASDWDHSRSVPLAALEPLLRVPGARFFSLQQGAPANEPLAQSLGIVPFSRHTSEVTAAAAAMLELDLIISVDNMVAHLAGTLARPTWLLLKEEADWRWMAQRSDSPWYPQMRLFRQRQAGDWDSIVHAAAQELGRLAARPGFEPAHAQFTGR